MLEGIIGLLGPLKDWLKLNSDVRNTRRQEEREALLALYTALNETRLYVNSQDATRLSRRSSSGSPPNPRSPEREEQLCRLWMEASVRLRHLNRDLAARCLIKSDYWAEPDSWADADVRAARIELDRVFKEARALL
jgi:hypothetical protein